MADIAVEPPLSRFAVLGDLVMDPSMDAWRKSTFCNGADTCVRVRRLPDGRIEVADEHGSVLAVPAGDWQVFVEGVKTGRLGWADGLVQMGWVARDVWSMWLTSDTETELRFDEGEVRAFVNGVHRDEFDLAALALSAGDDSGVDGRSEGPDGATAGCGGGSVPA